MYTAITAATSSVEVERWSEWASIQGPGSLLVGAYMYVCTCDKVALGFRQTSPGNTCTLVSLKLTALYKRGFNCVLI